MRVVLVVGMLCACNQVYGIVDTAGLDSDRDRVTDDVDNCPLAANRDQLDSDRDDLGDACDPCVDGPQLAIDNDADGVDDACDVCPNGPNTDEDGDGVADGCDVCPADVDPEQIDNDADGVGDACDHATGVINERVYFDGFAPIKPGWKTGFLRWANVDGSYVSLPPVGGQWRGSWNRASAVPATGYVLKTEVRLPAVAIGAQVGLEAITVTGGSTGNMCGVRRTSTGWQALVAGTDLMVGDTIRIEFRELVLAGGVASQCFIDGMLAYTTPKSGLLPRLLLLFAAEGAEYRWVDVIR